MIDFKKLLLFLIIAVVIAAAGFGLYLQKQWQKTHIPLDISLAAVQTKCLEDVSKMNEEQIIEKINTQSFAQLEELREINKNILSYLCCKLSNERREFDNNIKDNLYNRFVNLVNLLKIPEEEKNAELEGNIIVHPLEEGLPNEIALGPLVKLCSNGKAVPEFLEACARQREMFFAPKNINLLSSAERDLFNKIFKCDVICDNLNRFSGRETEFEDYIKKTGWSSNFDHLYYQALARIAEAYRIGGKDLALKILDLIPNQMVKENVKKYPESLEYINCKGYGFDTSKDCERKIYEECENDYKESQQLICNIETRK